MTLLRTARRRRRLIRTRENAGSVGPTYLHGPDPFTGPNGLQLDAYDPDYTIFRYNSATVTTPSSVQIQSNAVQIDSDLYGAIVEANAADCDVRFDWTPQGGQNRMNIVARFVDYNNMLLINAVGITSTIGVGTVINGTFSVIDNSAQVFTNSVTYNLRVVCDDTSISVYIDDVLIVSTTTATHQTATKHGFLCGASSAPQVIDMFEIRQV